MASIGTVTLTTTIDVANVDVNVVYTLTPSNYDVQSGQQYFESCKLIGDDTGITPAEDGTDDTIPNGLLTPLFQLPFSFTSNTPITRTFTKTLAKSDLNEDVGTDEIRAVVTLTPVLPVATTRESNQVTGNF